MTWVRSGLGVFAAALALGCSGGSSGSDSGSGGTAGSTPGDASATGGAGGSSTGGTGGTAGASTGGTGGSATGGTAGAGTGGGGTGGTAGAGGGMGGTAGVDAGPMVTVEWGATATFHDTDGSELGSVNVPGSFPLPDGGAVTILGGGRHTLYGVPAGATIRAPRFEPPQGDARQSIRVDVPDVPGRNIRISTGCSGATGDGVHVLEINTSCLHNDTAELRISAWASGAGSYIEVKDITVGAATDPPKDIPLPSYTPYPSPGPMVTVQNVSSGMMANARFYSFRGSAAVDNGTLGVPLTGSTGTTELLATTLTTGIEWRGGLILNGTGATQRNWIVLGHPLMQTTTFDADDLLPVPTGITVNWTGEKTVSWSVPTTATPAGLDLQRIELEWARDAGTDDTWFLWVPPGTTQVSLPELSSGPDTTMAPTRVEVRLEDQVDVDTWTQVLGDFVEVILFTSPDSYPPGVRISTAEINP